jgi:succinate dehydrogenase / fumarate reductase membrane anchor subunit
MAVYRTPLGRARGMGSAKDGVGQFIVQRVTAAALVLLVLWGAWSALMLARGGYDDAAGWLRSPLNAGLAVLLAVAGFWHMQLGMRVVIEDYIQRAGTKAALLVLNVFVAWAGCALTVISLLKVAFGGSSGTGLV